MNALWRVLVIVALIAVCVNLQTASAQTASPPIPGNTPVAIQLLVDLSSKSAVPGQVYPFEVAKPVILAGVTVIAPGTVVIAEVKQVQPAGKNRKRVALELIFWPVDSATDQLFSLDLSARGWIRCVRRSRVIVTDDSELRLLDDSDRLPIGPRLRRLVA